jgi:phage/plasmid-associated DNA primase
MDPSTTRNIDHGANDAGIAAEQHVPPKVYDEEEVLSIDEIIQKNVSKNIRDLRAFFNTNGFVTEKNNQKTNVISASEKRTYHVPETHIEEFFNILDLCRKESRMLHYMERQETLDNAHSGIMIDFDRYQRSKEPQFTERHFETLTRHISKLLHEFLDYEQETTSDTFIFRMFYIRKPAVILARDHGDGSLYKDGFHILIPEIQVIKGLKKFLLQELVARGMVKTTFKDIDHIEDPDKMLDKACASNPVHFFGNSKPGAPSYLLTHAYEIKFHVGEDDIDRRLMDIAPIAAGTMKSATGVVTPINLSYELSLGTYMKTLGGQPTWLTKRHICYRSSVAPKIQLLVEKTSKGIFSDDDLRRDEEDISLVGINNPRARHIMQLLQILGTSYTDEYEAWFKVICAIAHCGISEDYHHIAREFSKRRPTQWSSSEFERIWAEAIQHRDRPGKVPVTIGSIHFWAKTSSPSLYAEVQKNYYGNVLRRHAYENAGKIEHAHAADACFAMCSTKFVCDVGYNDLTCKTGYCWFEFVTSGQKIKKGEIYKWRRELEPDNIHLFISDHLPKVYSQVCDDIKSHKDAAKNKEELRHWADVEKHFKSSKTKLGNSGYQNGVMEQARYRFRARGFYDELDSYEDIIGVGNGVLRIGHEPELIKGFHEYKISKYTETDYIPFDPENPYVKVLLDAFHDIFPEEDVFNYMMFHAATGLDFKESACILTLLVGGGQNGKTFFAKMIHNTLGHMYCAGGKSALLTAPLERSESANSAQMQQKDKRWFYIDEFNKSELLNTGRVKMMVTPQWQSGREMYARQGNFKNTSNTICLSNFDFIVDTTDHGTWRRIYYYRNKVKFCKNPNPNNVFEKKEDHRFIDSYANDPLYKQAMLSIMVHFYSKLQREHNGNLAAVPVPTITRETEAFRNRQDALNKFITQMIVKSPAAEPVGMATLAGKYIDWYNQYIRQKTTQTITEIQTQIENSRIAYALERRTSTVVFLVGHRIKSRVEEPLLEGEEDLVSAVSAVDTPSRLVTGSKGSVILTQCPPRVADDIIPFLTELQRNAPEHIQRRVEDNIVDIDIGAVVNSLGI